MVYGEPWTGGTAAVSDGVTKTSIDDCSSSTTENGVACFNDNYRNGIKGAEFGGFKRGHVQGSLSTKEIIAGTLGSSTKFGTSTAYFTDVVGRSLNYVECHDNYTLYDKLVISLVCPEEDMSTIGDADLKQYCKAQSDLTAEQLTELKKQNKLCAALVFLAQGTPFINGGQEFMRTKQGDHNSYMSSDEINQIDLSFKTTNSDVYNTYKALISLRKDFSAFTNATNAVCKAARDENDEGIVGILKYAIEGTNGNFAVYINANGTEDSVRDGQEGYQVSINEATGEYSIATEIGKNFKIPAKGFLIVKTN
jgi:pullulanase